MKKHLLVIVNSEAGGPFFSLRHIAEILEEQDMPYEIHEMTTPDEAIKAVGSLPGKELTAIIAYGGDGTVLPIIKAAAKRGVPVLPLRGGSANGLARNIGISDDTDAALRAYLSGSYVIHEFPVASADGTPLLLDMHFGVFSKSIKSTPRGVKKWIGDKAYHFYTLKNATKDNKERYRFEPDGKPVEIDAYGCFVLNINVMKVFGINILPKAKPGHVQVMAVTTRNPAKLILWLASRLLIGIRINDALSSWQAKKVVFLEAPDSMTFDDAHKKTELPLTIEANTGQVSLIVPILRKKSWHKFWSIVSTEYYRQKDHLNRLRTGIPSVRFSQVSSRLYLGGQYGPKAIPMFSERGITGIVSMREYTPKQIDKKIEILHLPTKDMTPPTLEDLRRGVTFINRHINEGGSVYVHCRMGEGRGPTMAAAYLISTGFGTDQALAHLRHYRPFARPNKKQIKALREFEAESSS